MPYLSELLVSPAPAMAPPLPAPRGPLSAFVLEWLVRPPQALPPAPAPVDDPLYGEDSALALYLCYELHYRGFAGVDDGWEWEPSLVALVRELEAAFAARVRDEAGRDEGNDQGNVGVAERLYAMTHGDGDGRSLSRYVAERGTLAHLREFAIHRSCYQLKEADPHTWAIPRLAGAAKAAMVEIQADEYGGGGEHAMHQSLFAVTLRELGLDPSYGAYLDQTPGFTLATVNLVTFFGLHRRWRGALVGHLAVFEMTSVEPMGRYAAALRRFGIGPAGRHFYEVHVVADAHHETVAAEGLAAGLAAQEPALVGDILFGARAIMAVEATFTRRLLTAWAQGRSSLRASVDSVVIDEPAVASTPS